MGRRVGGMTAVDGATVDGATVGGATTAGSVAVDGGAAGMVAATWAGVTLRNSSATRGAHPSRPSSSRRAYQAHTVSRPITSTSSPATSSATAS